MKLPEHLGGRATALLERCKYPLGILLLGLVLLLWPSGGRTERETLPPETETAAPERLSEGEAYCRRTEETLIRLLGQIEGAGRVRVMLTLKSGPATQYQTDTSRTQRSEADRSELSQEEKTVILNRGSAYDEAAVVNTAYPVFQGALIVAEGGEDPQVRYRLLSAVSALLGLGADAITVVKMK